jgi:hypothetical protein
MDRFVGFLKTCSYGLGLFAVGLFLVWACTFVPAITASVIFKSIHGFVSLPLSLVIPAFFKANQQGTLFLYAIVTSVASFCYSQIIARVELWVINSQEQKQKQRAFNGPNLVQKIKAYLIDLKRGKLKGASATQLMASLKSTKNNYFFVLVSFPFQTNRAKGEVFYEYNFFEGKEVGSPPNTLLVKFNSLQQAIQYAKNTSQRLKHAYAQMRPSEVKPVFKIGIHACPDASNPETLGNLLNFCQELCKIASPSQVISSNDIYLTVTENKKTKAPCTLTPLGFYRFESSPMQEVFEVE